MGSYLVRVRSAFVLSAFLISRISRLSQKASAAAFAAFRNQDNLIVLRAASGLVGLRLGLCSHNTPISVTSGVALPVEHKERLMKE